MTDIDLQERCTNMSQRIVELEADLIEAEKEADDNLALAESLREECAKAQKNAADLKAEKDKIEARIAELATENEILKVQLDAVKSLSKKEGV